MEINQKITAPIHLSDEEQRKLVKITKPTVPSKILLGSVDNNVNQVCEEFIKRSQHGFTKYGVTTERADLNFDQWLQHLKEELMDSVVYVHRLQRERALDALDEIAKIDQELGLYDNEPTKGC